MKLAWRVVGIIGTAVAVIGFGCGKAKHPAETTSAQTSVPLPEWAPENPSPEFLRAARVLKPIPPEVFGQVQDSRLGTIWIRYRRTLIPAWEFFGLFSDEQVEAFLSSGQISTPVKSLMQRQRTVLDEYFEAWRENLAGGTLLPPDLLVHLYRDGAREDLSNVAIGFVSDGHGVNMQFWITRPDGSVSTPSNTVGTI